MISCFYDWNGLGRYPVHPINPIPFINPVHTVHPVYFVIYKFFIPI